ncbi:hypothetical protein E3N88_23438 [Mikania micrantha]|uniref:Major facilitator superfamily (MFS) profile domain-containing protein n=1 Tax=Mikania micrantha TaxID=192012 RepID=A0A5N6NF89_9ASTR|nr:hypothetical protein E3N88_23438 [Mikania micrantha]
MKYQLVNITDPEFKSDSTSSPSSSTPSMDLVTNGSVDFRGRVAKKRKTGGWKASPFIIANEAAERLSAFTVSASLVLYLTNEMKESLPDAATHVSDWVGATYLLMLLGAFLADAYLGRYLTVILSSAVYLVGMLQLTVSASVNSLRPTCPEKSNCPSATPGQSAFLYSALALVALGTGGVKPNVPAFGADQHDENDEIELSYKYTFFNLFFLSIKVGALLGLTVMVYIEQEKGYAWGFGLPTGIMFASVVILAAGFPRYRYKKPMGSVFTRFVQVIVVSVRNHYKGVQVSPEVKLYEVATEESAILGARKLSHTPQYRFLDKAAVVEDPEVTDINDPWKYFILGGAESFTYVGQLEFFYDEATDGMKSVCGALFLSEIGIGSWVNSALVKIVEQATGTGDNGWLRDDLNESKLDYYYLILAAISAVNLLLYIWVARRYKGRNQR